MKNEKKILLADVNQFITCVLCKGYLIDATTITECLHTFCKKCIVEYLEENTNCPICDTLLHQSHPLLYVAHDRTLQSIVYKLVANLEKSELERQMKFYDERTLDYPPQLREKLEQFNLLAKSLPNETGGKSDTNRANDPDGEKAKSATQPTKSADAKSTNNFHRDDEQIAICLEPLEGLKELDRKFLLCSCHATITHVKKYIALKIFSDVDLYKELVIMCDDEILGKDHTLKFIYVTKWKDKDTPMRLIFRPKLVF